MAQKPYYSWLLHAQKRKPAQYTIHLIAVIFAMAVWPNSSRAQTTQPTPATPTKHISFEFTAVAWEHELHDISLPKATTPLHLEIPPFERSKAYHYDGNNPIIIERNDAEYAKSHKNYTPFVKNLLIPSDWKRVLLLILPGAEGTFGVKPVRDDADEIKPETARIINISGEILCIKTLNQREILPSGEQKILQIPPGSKQLDFAYAKMVDNDWKLMGSKAVAASSDLRCTIIITKSDSDYFSETSLSFDESGAVINSKLPTRPFQIFTLTEKIKP
jgi:hypothetical protein